MVRTYRTVNRPKHLCSRGPERRKRPHFEDLQRLDVRDYIARAMPKLNYVWHGPEDGLTPFEDPRPGVSPYSRTHYTVPVTLAPERDQAEQDVQTVELRRGRPFKHGGANRSSHWWYWICPICGRQCRYLHAMGTALACRIDWSEVYCYRSQSKSRTQRQRDKPPEEMVWFYQGQFGDSYAYQGGRSYWITAPTPPANWVPPDLLKLYDGRCEA